MTAGTKFLEKYNKLPTANTIEETHTKIGSIDTINLDHIFYLMQGEQWSPNGEANNIISESDAGHTSMSVGDIIVMHTNDGKRIPHMVDNHGFVVLA